MSEHDLTALYSARILELTTQIPHLAPLAGAQGAGRARSPQCGSSVAVQVALAGGVISGFGQSVRACALGQASAAIFGAGVLGQSPAALAALRARLAAMLAQGGPPPDAPFADYALLQVARAYPNRHASILLCLDATLAACADAEAGEGASFEAGPGA